MLSLKFSLTANQLLPKLGFMQLSYRGVSYQPETNVSETSEAPIFGKYRGSTVQLGLMDNVPERVATLRYRGVSYLRFR